MDCEKFDQVALEALYDELDELTIAAVKRHTETCPQCRAKWAGLTATRELGVLPMVPVPVGFEHRILQAARDAQRTVPWPRRVGRAISWAGSYAMRPQTAMAAILLLMLGSSVIFVRVKPDRSAPGRVSVTERGTPEPTSEEVHPAPGIPLDLRPASGVLSAARTARRDEERAGSSAPSAFAAPPPGAREGLAASAEAKGLAAEPATEAPIAADEIPRASEQESRANAPPGAGNGAVSTGVGAAGGAADAYAKAMELYNAGQYAQAERAFAEVASSGARNAASASLYAAKSAEAGVGCSRAAAKYEATASRYGTTTPGAEALWGAANCYKAIGSFDKARQLYLALRSVAGYRDRAEGELATLAIQRQDQVATRAKAAARLAPASAAAAAAPAERPAAPPPAAAAKPAR